MADPVIIGALTAAIVALTGLIAAIAGLWQAIKSNTKTTNATHVLVNSLNDEKTARVDQVEHDLIRRGFPLPVPDPIVRGAQERLERE